MIGTEFFFGPLAATFLIGIPTLVLLYWWSIRNHDYWKKRGIRTAKTVPLLGSLLDYFRMPLHELEAYRHKEFGNLYGHFEGNTPLISVAEPSLLREILVKDFFSFPNRRTFDTGDKILDSMITIMQGEQWKRVRSIITPTFSTGKIKRMMSIFKECSRTLVQNFKTTAEAREPTDAKRIYGAFTLDVIASSAFSTKLDSHKDPDNKFVKQARIALNHTLGLRFLFFLAAPGLMKLLGISPFDKNNSKFFQDVICEIIEERKKTGKGRNDFLQLLLDTEKEVSQEEKSENAAKDILSNYGEDVDCQVLKTVTTKHLSKEEIVAQCVIFFLAGYDTTGTTLSLATYNLALYPEAQEKLRKEVDDALREANGELTYESVQSMKYLDNVISETLRLYPPAPRVERQAVSDYQLGDTGITIPKGMVVTIPVFAMHRDPKHFPEPLKFDPDRFTIEEREKRDQYAYMPFGVGPRNCVGMRFALVEIKVCLAHVISTFIIKTCPQTKIPVELKEGPGLMQPGEILLQLEMRTDCPLVK